MYEEKYIIISSYSSKYLQKGKITD